jgi:thiamine-monophosphate kinase
MQPNAFDAYWRLPRMPERVSDIGEFGLIRRISNLLKKEGIRSERITVGIGDDTASFIPRPGYELLVTCDCMVEGRHYLPKFIRPLDVGRRAMTLNISDIGAMGGRPLYALVSLGLKGETFVQDIEEMYRGFLVELTPFGASIIGGNLTESGNGMFIDITLIGEVEQGKAVRRSGAKPGDAILVTGYPGQAGAGLQLLLHSPGDPRLLGHPLVKIYNTPSHRAKLGEAIAKTGRATAMIDTSDGFLGDLGHICEESGVGAELFKEKIPVSEDLRKASNMLHRDPDDFFLGESDDYELVMTCRAQDVALLRSAISECGPVPVSEVGRITEAAREMILLLPGGEGRALKPLSWDHFRFQRRFHLDPATAAAEGIELKQQGRKESDV